MKIVHVPKLNIPRNELPCHRVQLLVEKGSEAVIDQVNWKNDFPTSMPVSVTLAHDGENLYLYYTVIGEALRAVNTEDFGSVWEDSCVEFFMQREGETVYRNFECNPLGVLLSRVNKKRGEGEPQTALMPSIFRRGTIQHRYAEDKQVSDWTMYLEIPKEALGFAKDELLSGQKIKGNFYKCGDKTLEPHFLSWSPIDLPEPNFHVPRFFGVLELE